MFSYSTSQDLKTQLQTSQLSSQREKVVKGTRNRSLHQIIIIMQQLTLHLDSLTTVNQPNNLSKHQRQGIFTDQNKQQT